MHASEMWTIDSLRPPTPADGPFDALRTKMVVAADVQVQPVPLPSPAWDRAMRRFPGLPLEAELSRLCRTYNAEVLSALASGLNHLADRPKRRARHIGSVHAKVRLGHEGRRAAADTKHFANVQRKYRQFDLPHELQRLTEAFPEAALFAVARALLRALRGRSGRGRPRLQGFTGVPAGTRAFVQARRLIGRSDLEIARCLEAKLEAGQSKLSLRKRAHREVASVPHAPGQFRLAFILVVELWAITRAKRQIEVISQRLPVTECQALACFAIRKSRFMSRALRVTPL